MAINLNDYRNQICELIRDVLRGVDTSGTPNQYTSFVVHPITPATDIRTWIISGIFPETIPVGITVRYGDDGNENASQGVQLTRFTDATINMNIDTSGMEEGQENALNKLVSQIKKTFIENSELIYQNGPFTRLDLQTSNLTDPLGHFSNVITLSADFDIEV